MLLYRMVEEFPNPIKGIDRNIRSGGWHTIRVVQKGCEIQAFFDGESMFRLCDSGLTTGRIGLWTNAEYRRMLMISAYADCTRLDADSPHPAVAPPRGAHCLSGQHRPYPVRIARGSSALRLTK
ncbi:MAG: hypothetical protein U0361_07440 [Nitrospiraceae bacterium]